MRRFIAGLGVGLVATTVQAQSSITLYGIVDTGLAINPNADGRRLYALSSGNVAGNRFGFKGTEDLGNGLSGIFTLEAGFSSVNGTMGQNGTEFGRQALLGLASSNYGTATFGRQYTTVYNFLGPFASTYDWAASGVGYGAHPGDIDNINSTNRIASSAKFLSQTYRGLTFGASYSFGNQPGSISRDQIWGIAVGYVAGPVKFATGYQSTRNPNFSFWGNKANDSATGSNIKSPVISGYATASEQTIFGTGLSYTFGSAMADVLYTNTRFENLGETSVTGISATQARYRGTASFNSYEANIRYFFTLSLLLGASYDFTRNGGSNGLPGASYQQLNLGTDYFVSKRTDFYLGIYLQKAAGTDSTGKSAVAAINGATAASTNRQVLALIGMRHKF